MKCADFPTWRADESTTPPANEEFRAKSIWLRKLRWVAIAGQLACLWPGLNLGLVEQTDVFSYLAVVVVLALFNIGFQKILAWLRLDGEWALFFQICVDLCVLASLLCLSKGCVNPMASLFYLHAAIGPLLLSGRRNIAFLAMIGTALMIVCFTSMPITHIHNGATIPRWVKLASELAVVGLVWQLTTWLSHYLTSLRLSISRLERQKTRIDNLRALGAMAASFSHEFATPLNTIKLRLDRLKRQDIALANNVNLAAATKGVMQCEQVLRSLFEINPDFATVKLEPVNIVDFVESACSQWTKSQEKVSFTFSTDTEARQVRCKIPSIIFARTIIDLLDNALEASGADPRVEVKVSSFSTVAVVEVADRGHGLSPQIKERLGDPFVSSKSNGAGLGLFSAHALVEALGGALKITDRAGGGSVIGLTIPLAEASA